MKSEEVRGPTGEMLSLRDVLGTEVQVPDDAVVEPRRQGLVSSQPGLISELTMVHSDLVC